MIDETLRFKLEAKYNELYYQYVHKNCKKCRDNKLQKQRGCHLLQGWKLPACKTQDNTLHSKLVKTEEYKNCVNDITSSINEMRNRK